MGLPSIFPAVFTSGPVRLLGIREYNFGDYWAIRPDCDTMILTGNFSILWTTTDPLAYQLVPTYYGHPFITIRSHGISQHLTTSKSHGIWRRSNLTARGQEKITLIDLAANKQTTINSSATKRHNTKSYVNKHSCSVCHRKTWDDVRSVVQFCRRKTWDAVRFWA